MENEQHNEEKKKAQTPQKPHSNKPEHQDHLIENDKNHVIASSKKIDLSDEDHALDSGI